MASAWRTVTSAAAAAAEWASRVAPLSLCAVQCMTASGTVLPSSATPSVEAMAQVWKEAEIATGRMPHL